MSRQRAIFQPAGNIDPANSVRMQGEGARTAQSDHANAGIEIVRSVGSKVLFVIGVIEPRPFFLLSVPPDEFLALAPGFAVGISGGAVVDDAAIVRPGETPAVPEEIAWISLVGTIAAFFGVNPAINPCAARSRAIVLQFLHVRNLFPVSYRPAIDLLQHNFNFWLLLLTFDRVIPCERVQSGVAGASIAFCFFLQPPSQVIDKPGVAAGIAGRVHSFLAELQQALGVGEGSGFLGGAGCRKEKYLGGNIFST